MSIGGHWIDSGGWHDQAEVRELLRAAVKTFGGQNKWAADHGVSAQYVCDVIAGRRLPGEAITCALGLEKAMLWRAPQPRKRTTVSRPERGAP